MDAPGRARYAALVRRFLLSSLRLAVLVGCTGTATQQPAERAQRGGVNGGESPRQREDLRALGDDASFATLLDAARVLDQRRDQESSSGCLLRRAPPWRLEADLAVAVRPLPPSRDDLDDVLASDAGPVTVLSRWGAYGSGDPERPSLVAVTTTLPPLREPALVWAITDRGVYVRSSRAGSDAGPRQTGELSASLPSGDALGALFVTAESATPLARLAEVLATVPPELAGRVALAVVLERGTRIPEPPAPIERSDPSEGLCPDGLPPLPEGAPEGELRTDRIVQSLAPLRQGAEICVGASQGPGAAGGRVEIALRIGADGSVEEACAVREDTADPELRACLLRAARATAFPVPDPPGAIDVQLPLSLAPLASQRQSALCP